MPAEHTLRTTRVRMAIAAATLLCSYLYFYEGGGWNQNTRFDLTREIVVHRALTIDDYGDNTGDKSRIGGHTYIDKAPGASFTAVPAVSVVRAVLKREGRRPDSPQSVMWMSYAATVAASAIPIVIGALALFWISRRVLRASDAGAGLTVIAFGLGSPMWAYAILFFGHALCAGCLLVALAAACALRLYRTLRARVILGAVVGIAGGWATVSEYPCLVPAALIAAFAMRNVWPDGRRHILRAGAALAASACACGAVLVWYNWTAFGHPLTISYTHYDDPVVMHSGFFDIVGPNWRLLPLLLFGHFRGLVPLAPVLALAPIGLMHVYRDTRTRWLSVLALSATVFAVLLNISYIKWEGGWNYGPRHMMWSLGFAYLGIGPLWTCAGRWVRALLLACVTAGIVTALIAVSTTVQPPSVFPHPMAELWWPAFSLGMLSLNRQTFLDLRPEGGPSYLLHTGGFRAAWNLGQKMGLAGHMSLLPLLALWMVAGVAWAWAGRSEVN